MGKRQSKYAGGGEAKTVSTVAPSPPLHDGGILGIACLSDTTVVTCSDDKSLCIYDTNTHQPTGYLKGHTKAVNRVVAQEDLIWSCSRDLSIKLWDRKTSECIRTFENAHTLNIAGISYNGVKNQLASGSRDYHVKTWDTETGACINEYTAPRNIVTCMQYDPTGNLLYQGSEDLCIRAWDTRSSNSQPAFHISGFVYFPLSISVCPTDGGVYIAAGCKGFNSVGCNVKVWDIRSTNASLLADMSGHDHDVNACTFLNSSQVLSASKDGTMRLWNPQSSQGGSAETTRYCSEDNLQYTSIGYYNPGNSSSSAKNEPLKFVVGSFNGSLTECSFSPSTDSIEMIYQTSFNN